MTASFLLSSVRRGGLAVALALAGTLASAQPAAVPDAAASAPVDALYVDLGGQPGIDRIVEDFVPRLAADPHMSEFFRSVAQPHFKAMLKLEFCVVAGGGCTYTGKPIKEAHQDMDISRADFNNLVEVLQASMAAQGVPFATQNRFLARLAPLHREIISVH
jgi:hemoglobin